MELINDHFQNRKQYNIPKAQLVIADIPYNIGKNAYGSNPKWYIDGDSSKGETNKAGCMIVFCAFEQQFDLIEEAKKHGFKNYIPLTFYKNYSAQVLKANMRIVGNTEYALLFYRDKLPKFNNNGRMIFNTMPMDRDTETPRIHPTQKPLSLLKYLIEIFTDRGDVVIDPCAGSGSTLLAAEQLGRKAYGFEIKKEFCREFEKKLNKNIEIELSF
jgi:site-specific DNA-methyltransferase (adenine-specific)